MRYGSERLRRTGAGFALLVGVLLLLGARPAAADPQGLPFILPRDSVNLVRQLNRAVHINVLSFSEVPIDDKGTVVKTAVVELISGAGVIVPPRLPLFLPAAEVTLVQQLNQGLPIQPLAVFPYLLLPSFQWIQTAVVLISPTVESLPKLGPGDFLLVLPGTSITLFVQANGGSNVSVVRVSQVTGGGSSTQTALVVVRQSGGANASIQIIVPESDLGALIRLNPSLNFEVVKTVDIVQGGVTIKGVLLNVTRKPSDGGGF
jgi:hypothetical protein